ncbi:MAG TPA: phage/plasmid primase, P4 family [Nitrososphaeraceae archaeon]|jgi:P4 family phage/plasmid primase-like protien
MISPEDLNGWADYWRYKIGVNAIPADTRIKKPLVAWSEFQNKPVSDELHNNWKSNGDFKKGIAIIVGKIFHRKDRIGYYLICIDADNLKAITEICTRNGKTVTLQNFAGKTLIEQHRDNLKKAHFYFYAPRPIAKKGCDVACLVVNNDVPAFEVKSLGGHGIMYCTPSIHKDGYRYEILGLREPVILSIIQVDELEKHLDDICKRNGIHYLENGNKLLRPIADLFKDDTKIYEGHNRHEAVLRIAESLIKRNRAILSSDKIKVIVLEWNEQHCVPPLDRTEVERQWKDAASFIAKKGAALIPVGNIQSQRQIQIHNAVGDETISPKEKMAFLVEELMKAYTFKTLRDTESILYYKKGKYCYGGEQLIKAELEELGGYSITTHLRTEVINHVKARTLVERSEFDKDRDILNVKNGLINIRTGEFKVHDPSYLSLVQLPEPYHPKARPKKIITFIYNVLDPSDVPLILECIGYCLIRSNKFQKDLMCVGADDNGKSVMLKVISDLLGIENVSSKTLHSLVNERFAKADLFGKLANIFADLSAKRLPDVEVFKVLASGDRISAERKFQHSFEFEPTTKHIFSANTPPKPSEDMDNAYYKRWILISFNLRKNCYFCKKPIIKDPDLLENLTTEAELSGLLNLALISARRLLLKRRFVKSPTTEQIRERYQRLSDPVKAWLDDRCVLGAQYETDKQEAHSDFINYCRDKRLYRLEINALGRELSKYNIHDKRFGTGSGRIHLWSGFALMSTLSKDGQEALL